MPPSSPPIPPPPWLAQPYLRLLASAVGGPDALSRKLAGAAATLGAYASPPVVEGRLRQLVAIGLIEQVPTYSQLLVAGQHMMLGTASDETRLFYESQGIPFTRHNLRRFIDYPSAMMDPVGFLSDRDTIIHHILTTAHRHPVYDFQLLRMFDGGLDLLLSRVEAVAAGRDPEQARFEGLVEDPSYFARLLPQVRAFHADPSTPAETPAYPYSADPQLKLAMDQFKDVPGFIRYAARLPAGPSELASAVGQELYKVSIGRLGPRPPVAVRYDLCDQALRRRYLGDAA